MILNIHTFLTRIKELFLDEYERWVLWLPIFMCFGILIYNLEIVNPPNNLVLISTIILFICFILFRLKGYLALSVAVCPVIALLAGYSASEYEVQRSKIEILSEPIEEVMVYGWIESISKLEKGHRLIIKPNYIKGIAKESLPPLIRVKSNANEIPFQIGDKVGFRANLFPLPKPYFPDGYDFGKQLYFEGIGATGYTISKIFPDKYQTEKPEQNSLKQAIEKLRNYMNIAIYKNLPPPYGALAAAMITGDQSAIPDDTIEAMRASGISHLLSISGVHIGLVAMIVFWWFRTIISLIPYIALRYNTKKIATFAAIMVTGFYTLISGLQIPAVRSFIMVCVVMTAILINRKAVSLRSVGLAVMVILLFEPHALFSASFHLSFAATICLVAYYEYLEGRHAFVESTTLGKAISYVKISFMTSLIAGLATMPLVIYHFNQIQTYSIISNMAVSLPTSIIVMPSVILTLFGFAIGLEGYFLKLLEFGLWMINQVAVFTASLPSASIFIATPSKIAIALTALSIFWMICWKGKIRYLAMIPLMFAVPNIFIAKPPLIISNGKVAMVRISDDKALFLNKGRGGDFLRDVWQRKMAVYEVEKVKIQPYQIIDNLDIAVISKDYNQEPLECNKLKYIINLSDERIADESCSQIEIFIDKQDSVVAIYE